MIRERRKRSQYEMIGKGRCIRRSLMKDFGYIRGMPETGDMPAPAKLLKHVPRKPKPPLYTFGYTRIYADEGADFDFLLGNQTRIAIKESQ